jgi:hypothetical protein
MEIKYLSWHPCFEGEERPSGPSVSFFVYVGIDGMGYMGISLHPGDQLTISEHGKDEEGWHFSCDQYEHTGEFIARYCGTDGSDCDGRLSTSDLSECRIDKLDAWLPEQNTIWGKNPKDPDGDYIDMGLEPRPEDQKPTPAWERTESSRRDYRAESMGY